MSELVLTLASAPEYSLDLSPLTPDRLRGMNIKTIQNIKLPYGNQQVKVKDFFAVKGNDPGSIRIKKSRPQLCYIGNGMSTGRLIVEGNAGGYAGFQMRGGTLRINGNSGMATGCGMKNGTIEITGDTGDGLGSSLPGERHGMSNGLIRVHGDAGDRVGDRMRRGMIIIHGNTGDYCGSRMLAGTIIVLKRAGHHPGFSMKRGSLILAREPAEISPLFKSCGLLKLDFLSLIFKQPGQLKDSLNVFKQYGPDVHRYAGDLSIGGKGEILILQKNKPRRR